MHRVIRRVLPSGLEYVPVQTWTPPDRPRGARLSQLAVEWHSSQPGHPTSFALLGGDAVLGSAQLAIPLDGDPYRPRRFGPSYGRRFGLPNEYRDAVLNALPSGVTISVAAYDPTGSSMVAFRIAARLLGRFLTEGI